MHHESVITLQAEINLEKDNSVQNREVYGRHFWRQLKTPRKLFERRQWLDEFIRVDQLNTASKTVTLLLFRR
ncbi:MAG: hypothetical protein ACJAYN_003039 [Bermanella sp.]|jgi:hypothetical protein